MCEVHENYGIVMDKSRTKNLVYIPIALCIKNFAMVEILK